MVSFESLTKAIPRKNKHNDDYIETVFWLYIHQVESQDCFADIATVVALLEEHRQKLANKIITERFKQVFKID